MQNSQIPVTIRLVHMQEITDYTGTGSVMQDELNMQSATLDPSLSYPEVLGLRNTRMAPGSGRSGHQQRQLNRKADSRSR